MLRQVKVNVRSDPVWDCVTLKAAHNLSSAFCHNWEEAAWLPNTKIGRKLFEVELDKMDVPDIRASNLSNPAASQRLPPRQLSLWFTCAETWIYNNPTIMWGAA